MHGDCYPFRPFRGKYSSAMRGNRLTPPSIMMIVAAVLTNRKSRKHLSIASQSSKRWLEAVEIDVARAASQVCQTPAESKNHQAQFERMRPV